MSDDSLAYSSAAELARRIARREISPVEIVRHQLERIERLDRVLGSFVLVLAERALRDARAAETEIVANGPRGPLHGIPIALKDIFDTAGLPTAAGSKILSGRVAANDAPVVERLRQAGTILLGKLNMHEFAYGITTSNPHFGPCRNPWNRDRVPGGSSGGSGAALAAGLCTLSLGTDTGGSIRIPASACGVAGLKPTFGRTSRRGVLPLAWSLDHVGPMARSAEDLALLLGAMATADRDDPWCAVEPEVDFAAELERGVHELKLGVPHRHFFEDLEPDVERAVGEAISVLVDQGARRTEVDVPHIAHAYTAFHAILASEASAFHRRWLQTRPDDYGEDVRRGLELGAFIPAIDYVDARRMQALLTDELAAALRGAHVLMTPTLPRTAPEIGEPLTREPREAWNRCVAPFNLAGLPAVSIPCGFDRGGMPIGLQIAGRWFDEATVLRVAHTYQRATEWHLKRPRGLD